MPELPEVETIRRGLEEKILHKRVMRVVILCDKSWRGLGKELVEGQQIVRLERRGKALLMRLENKLWMMAHLRMTGQMVYVGAERFAAGHPDSGFLDEMPGRHTRIYFEFDDGTHLYFNDQRKFGFIKVLDELGLQSDTFLSSLAPEPWDMSEDEFWARLQRHKKAIIKAVILDQKMIAGVGNIYADEACFAAGLYPGTRVAAVSRETADLLLRGLREVMQRSIDSGGSTMKDYVRADGTKGSYLEKFAQVFRREGELCRRCGNEILKTRVAGRGTHYCPHCQPKGRSDA
ncbi:bifunctional DNA-formamidopyrimidine glycosylase/DNA-(apurinic or apyrimidinic site) lyase [Candidatus Saccharibacteria bacterium]|nr:bifunctional DNA-formamidopyrimidine glycosylase/DNA-(apurinic or apyrimidinic site) lyase [Candidatus Saccharibacteria bacterium]